MKICLAQTKPIKGDIAQNIEQHKQLIFQGISQGADFIIFPELSLTGYEPELAQELALDIGNKRLDTFQEISNSHDITIAVGAPTRHKNGICISLIIFRPSQERKRYSKKYLHVDEEPFFVSGDNFPVLHVKGKRLALAICYEISVEAHANEAFNHKPDIYIASVAKHSEGMEQASDRLSYLAKTHQVPTLIVNCVGPSSGFESAGMSSAWNADGNLIGQLEADQEGTEVFELGV